MPDPRKSYVGLIEDEYRSLKPRAFVGMLAGYSRWAISQALDVQFSQDGEFATIKLTRAYGQGSVVVLITASDSYVHAGRSVQRVVALTVTFDDPNDWHDSASEELVARTMKEFDEAIAKLTSIEGIWRRETGYWRCGARLYQCPDSPSAEPEVVPPPLSPPRIESGAAYVADVGIANTEHNAVEGGVAGMRWQSTFRVVNGLGGHFCAKLIILEPNGFAVKARESDNFADYHGNISIFCQLD